MAKRSPLGSGTSYTVPAFNPGDVQSHAYWGQYTYNASVAPNSIQGRSGSAGSKMLPNEALNPLGAPEFEKLRTGDIASTAFDVGVAGGTAPSSLVQAQAQGLFVCIYPGTVGGGNAVWVRMDEATPVTQTIRDAHVIVVAQQGYLTALAGVAIPPLATNSLNLGATGDQLGVTCDYLDTGNGAELDLALAAALAGGIPVDVRLRPCDITLTGGATPAVLTVPSNCRLIGAGKDLSTITGTTGVAAAVQNVFAAQAGATIEDLSVISPAPTAAPGASGLGVINCEEGVQVRRCSVSLELSTTVDRNGARAGISFIPAGGDLGFELVDDCELHIDSLLGQTTPIASIGINFGQASTRALTSFDPEVRNTTVDQFTPGVGSSPIAVQFLNVEGGRCFNVEHYNAAAVLSFSWTWAFVPGVAETRKIRGPRFVECRAEEFPTAVQLATNQFGFLMSLGLASNLTNGIYGAMFHDCVVKFAVPTSPSPSASLRGFTLSNVATDNSDIYDTTFDNCRVENGHRDFIITASDAGRIESVRMTGCQGRDTVDGGALAPRGVILTGNPLANNATVIQVGIQNCDFTGCPATGVAVDIVDVRVENTIVLGNNLTPNGGTAITDAGTGTEAAHNITV